MRPINRAGVAWTKWTLSTFNIVCIGAKQEARSILRQLLPIQRSHGRATHRPKFTSLNGLIAGPGPDLFERMIDHSTDDSGP